MGARWWEGSNGPEDFRGLVQPRSKQEQLETRPRAYLRPFCCSPPPTDFWGRCLQQSSRERCIHVGSAARSIPRCITHVRNWWRRHSCDERAISQQIPSRPTTLDTTLGSRLRRLPCSGHSRAAERHRATIPLYCAKPPTPEPRACVISRLKDPNHGMRCEGHEVKTSPRSDGVAFLSVFLWVRQIYSPACVSAQPNGLETHTIPK